jgi:3-hydroxyisobutyrate dehydrogenase
MMQRIGFVGLGVMGSRMAGHLLREGHPLWVWNRTDSKCKPLVEMGAEAAGSLEFLASHCNIIVICVSRTEDVESVISSMLPTAQTGTLFIDHSTIEPAAAKRLGEKLRAVGFRFLDAPVTGGERGAIDGTLTVFCGGDERDYAEAAPLLAAYAKSVRLVGEQGAGQMMKMVNQVSVALCVLAMSESMVLAEKAGLSLQDVLDLVGAGAGGSWSLSHYGPKVIARDWSPGFAVELQQKDLVYALRAAREVGVSLPGTALVHQLFAALENSGRGGDATPALFEVIEGLSGVGR